MTYNIEALAGGGGLKKQGEAAAALTRTQLVYVDAEGHYDLANASLISSMPVVAITTERISVGQRGSLLFIGLLQSNTWSFIPNSLLYASTIPGEIATTPPNESGSQVQVVGIALSQTLIMFNPAYVLVEVA